MECFVLELTSLRYSHLNQLDATAVFLAPFNSKSCDYDEITKEGFKRSMRKKSVPVPGETNDAEPWSDGMPSTAE